MKKNKFLLFAAMAVAVLTSCGGGQQGLPTSDEYPVVTIGPANAQLKTTYPASIKGVQNVDVRPKVTGFITKLCVHEGEAVKAGQLLFVVDNSTYEAAVRAAQAGVTQAQAGVRSAQAGIATANAALNSANAQASTAKLTYTNSQNLFNNKVIGDFELQAARNTYETAQASVRQAQSGVASANAALKQAEAAVASAEAQLATAKENLSFCYVKSPATGVIGSLPYDEGALVSPSSAQPVMTVSDISTIEVYFSMSEADILKLTRGNNGLAGAINSFPPVSLQLTDGSIYNHQGTVVKTSGILDATTGALSIIARFPNPEHLLKSGGSGQIVVAKSDNSAILIPMEATSQVQDKYFVYKVDGNGKVHYSEITVGPQNDGNNYIVTSGLKMGDRVVLKGINGLTEGQQIKAITPAEYEAALKKSADLGAKQGSSEGFLEAMTGKDK